MEIFPIDRNQNLHFLCVSWVVWFKINYTSTLKLLKDTENSRDIYPFCQHPHKSQIFKFRLLSTIYSADTGLLAIVPRKQLHSVYLH